MSSVHYFQVLELQSHPYTLRRDTVYDPRVLSFFGEDSYKRPSLKLASLKILGRAIQSGAIQSGAHSSVRICCCTYCDNDERRRRKTTTKDDDDDERRRRRRQHYSLKCSLVVLQVEDARCAMEIYNVVSTTSKKKKKET